jgi:hypothetical protein
MNKLIETIAEQATEEVLQNTPSFLVTNEMWKAKFAELIVREAAKLVASTQVTKDGHTWRAADYVVLEHFGVKP